MSTVPSGTPPSSGHFANKEIDHGEIDDKAEKYFKNIEPLSKPGRFSGLSIQTVKIKDDAGKIQKKEVLIERFILGVWWDKLWTKNFDAKVKNAARELIKESKKEVLGRGHDVQYVNIMNNLAKRANLIPANSARLTMDQLITQIGPSTIIQTPKGSKTSKVKAKVTAIASEKPLSKELIQQKTKEAMDHLRGEFGPFTIVYNQRSKPEVQFIFKTKAERDAAIKKIIERLGDNPNVILDETTARFSKHLPNDPKGNFLFKLDDTETHNLLGFIGLTVPKGDKALYDGIIEGLRKLRTSEPLPDYEIPPPPPKLSEPAVQQQKSADQAQAKKTAPAELEPPPPPPEEQAAAQQAKQTATAESAPPPPPAPKISVEDAARILLNISDNIELDLDDVSNPRVTFKFSNKQAVTEGVQNLKSAFSKLDPPHPLEKEDRNVIRTGSLYAQVKHEFALTPYETLRLLGISPGDLPENIYKNARESGIGATLTDLQQRLKSGLTLKDIAPPPPPPTEPVKTTSQTSAPEEIDEKTLQPLSKPADTPEELASMFLKISDNIEFREGVPGIRQVKFNFNDENAAEKGKNKLVRLFENMNPPEYLNIERSDESTEFELNIYETVRLMGYPKKLTQEDTIRNAVIFLRSEDTLIKLQELLDSGKTLREIAPPPSLPMAEHPITSVSTGGTTSSPETLAKEVSQSTAQPASAGSTLSKGDNIKADKDLLPEIGAATKVAEGPKPESDEAMIKRTREMLGKLSPQYTMAPYGYPASPTVDLIFNSEKDREDAKSEICLIIKEETGETIDPKNFQPFLSREITNPDQSKQFAFRLLPEQLARVLGYKSEANKQYQSDIVKILSYVVQNPTPRLTSPGANPSEAAPAVASTPASAVADKVTPAASAALKVSQAVAQTVQDVGKKPEKPIAPSQETMDAVKKISGFSPSFVIVDSPLGDKQIRLLFKAQKEKEEVQAKLKAIFEKLENIENDFSKSWHHEKDPGADFALTLSSSESMSLLGFDLNKDTYELQEEENDRFKELIINVEKTLKK